MNNRTKTRIMKLASILSIIASIISEKRSLEIDRLIHTMEPVFDYYKSGYEHWGKYFVKNICFVFKTDSKYIQHLYDSNQHHLGTAYNENQEDFRRSLHCKKSDKSRLLKTSNLDSSLNPNHAVFVHIAKDIKSEIVSINKIDLYIKNHPQIDRYFITDRDLIKFERIIRKNGRNATDYHEFVTPICSSKSLKKIVQKMPEISQAVTCFLKKEKNVVTSIQNAPAEQILIFDGQLQQTILLKIENKKSFLAYTTHKTKGKFSKAEDSHTFFASLRDDFIQICKDNFEKKKFMEKSDWSTMILDDLLRLLKRYEIIKKMPNLKTHPEIVPMIFPYQIFYDNNSNKIYLTVVTILVSFEKPKYVLNTAVGNNDVFEFYSDIFNIDQIKAFRKYLGVLAITLYPKERY